MTKLNSTRASDARRVSPAVSLLLLLDHIATRIAYLSGFADVNSKSFSGNS